MNIGLFAAGRTVRDGLVTPGFFHITEPGAAVRCIFRGSYDVLHLYVSNNLIAECASQMPGVAPRLLSSTKPGVDPVIGRLGRALIEADLNCSRLGPLYGDSIGIAIVTRLLGRLSEAAKASDRLRRNQPHKAGAPRRRRFRRGPYFHAFRSAVQGGHRASTARIYASTTD
jgi:hypothetical protein